MAKEKRYTAVDEKKLRALGWMTTDEFLEKFNVGLEYYLKENTYLGNEDNLHHPEDLIVNVSSYVEVAYHVLVSFAPTPEEKGK